MREACVTGQDARLRDLASPRATDATEPVCSAAAESEYTNSPKKLENSLKCQHDASPQRCPLGAERLRFFFQISCVCSVSRRGEGRGTHSFTLAGIYILFCFT